MQSPPPGTPQAPGPVPLSGWPCARSAPSHGARPPPRTAARGPPGAQAPPAAARSAGTAPCPQQPVASRDARPLATIQQ